jgi:signal transduction histidine kinase
VPGVLANPPALPPSGLALPLVAAWVLAGTSMLAIAALLAGIATLGERREAFVSAVTHELRTPLTTFRMYADMLADGMVTDEEQERLYLATLRREAERQSHLVENVLAYSRLERGRYAAARDTMAVSDLLDTVTPALAEQAARSGMTLVAPDRGECLSTTVRVDRSAVERILFNLVDNACKYARAAADPRIHLECERDGRQVRLAVSDHGPGIGRGEACRLFKPFRKSAREAAHSAPGVGLGLALSRRLARAIGGDLTLSRSDERGAAFCLTLPR